MAEDFLPVGIKATVVGVDDFLADLRRMQAGVAKLGEFVKDSAADLRVFGGAAQAVSQSARAFSTETNRMAQSARQVNTSVTALNRAVTGLAQKLGQAAPRAQAFSVSVTRTRGALQNTSNVATRFFNTLSIGFGRIARGSDIYRRQEIAIRRLKDQYTAAKNAANQMQQEVDQNTRAVAKEERALERAIDAYRKNNRELRNVAQQLNKAVEAQNKFRASGGSAEEATRKYGASIAALRARLGQLVLEQVRTSEAMNVANGRFHQARSQAAALASQLATTRGVLAALAGSIASAQTRMTLLSTGISLVTTSLRALGVAAAVVVGAVNGLRIAFAAVTAPIRGLNRAFVGLANRIRAINTQFTTLASRAFRVGNSIRFLGTSMTFLITFPIVGFLGSLTNAAVEFEEAWAGVVRTVSDPKLSDSFRLIVEGSNDIKDLTPIGENLRQGIRNLALEIPIAADELARIGEIAGTLGIRGNKSLIAFIETVARLGSTTNVSTEDAAVGLGKLIGVAGGLGEAELAAIGWSKAQIESAKSSEVFQASALALGGVLTALGNRTEAFESEILNFSRKIAGVSNIVGLTSAEILGFSASFVRAGVDAARGGTAFQKVMTRMLEAVQSGNEELKIFATVAGETVEGFVELFEKDASEAIRFFIEGLGQAGKEGVAVLDAIDLADARVLASILSLAATQGKLSDSLNIVNEELKIQGKSLGELNALLVESERRYSTTKSQLQLLKNQFTDLGITIGDFLLPHINTMVTRIRGLIEGFSRLHPNVIRFVLVMAGLVAIIGPVITATGLMLASFGFLFKVIFSAIGVILSLASTLGLAIFPIAALAAAIVGLGIAFVAAFRKIDRFADLTAETLVTKMAEFGKNIILAFAKGMAAAMIAVVRVLNEIGKVIARWLKPGSPPRLLPDLDKWGAGAATSYMRGWLEGDFDVFNELADKIERFLRSITDASDAAGRESLVRSIIGSRRVVARAVNEIRQIGRVTSSTMRQIENVTKSAAGQFRRYVKALIDVRIASEQVRQAQEEVNRIMREYEEALRPIEHRLREIDRRQQDISDRSRIIELEAVLADPRAPEIVRELANLEIEEIGLQTEARQVEALRDEQLLLAETELAAAEARLEVAEAELRVAEAMIDATIKENELLQEMKKAAEDAAKALKDAGGALDLGAIEGFDPEALDLENIFADEEGLIEGLISGLEVDSIADIISESFNELVKEIKKEFEPLFGEGGLFDQLGETWAPIFETILGHIERYLPKAEAVLATMDRWNEGSQKLAETIAGVLDGAIRDVAAILIELGIIEPFGPFLEEGEEMVTIVTKIKDFVEKVRGSIDEFLESTAVGQYLMALFTGEIGSLKASFDALKGALDPIVAAWENELKPALTFLFETLRDVWNNSEELQIALRGLAKVIGIVVGAMFALSVGILTGLVQGLARAIEFGAQFISRFIRFLALLIQGIFSFWEGVVTFVKGVIEGIKGNTDEAGKLITEGMGKIASGILNILEGLAGAIVNLVGTLVAAVIGLFLGMFEGIVKFFTNLKNELVGNSIVPDIVEAIIGLFDGMVEYVLAAISGFVTALIGKMADVYNAIVDGIETALDWLARLPGRLFTLGANAIQGFINGIGSKIGDVVDAVAGIGGNILDGIKDRLGISSPSREFESIGEDSMEGWIKGVETNLNLITRMYREASRAVTKIVEDMHESQNDLVETNLDDLSTFVISWLRDILDKFITFGEEYSIGGRDSLWGRVLQAVVELWEDHIREMRRITDDFVELFDRMIEEIRQSFLSAQPAFRAVGRSLINSMIAGLNSRAPALMARARRIAEQVSATINSAFEFGSPSKVFFDIGKNLVESWAIGMESAEQSLLAAVGDLASTLAGQQAIQPALAEGAFRQAALPAASQTVVNREVNIDLGGQQINNGMDAFELQILIEQAVKRAVG